MKTIGILLIAAGVISCLVSSPFYLAGFGFGFVLLAFGEIIKLLHEINERMKKNQADKWIDK